MGFSIEQHGLYILALVFQFNNGHFSEQQINSILDNRFNEIKHKFKTDGKTFWNERLDLEKIKRSEYCESRRVLIDKRWSKNDKPLSGKRLSNIHTYQQNVVNPLIRMENENEDKNKDVIKDKNIIPPTIEMVTKYCIERKNTIDPQTFIDHYEARGWLFKTGQKVKDWQAAVRTWEKNEYNKSTNKKPHQSDGGGYAKYMASLST